MRKLSFVFLAASLAAGSAFAAPAAPSNIEASGGASQLALTSQQLHEIAGDYALTNGRVVRLTIVDDRLYADLNGHSRNELVATGSNTFASRDGAVSVTYQPQESGDKILLSYDRNTRAPGIASVRDRGSLWFTR